MKSTINETKTNPQKHSHAGHRERMKETVLKKGFKHLYDHELLEFLLFYAIPRRDTNELAHHLMERFGSLNDLLEADTDQIVACTGMGENSALLLKAIMETVIRYSNNTAEPIYRYDKLTKVYKYLVNYYMAIKQEVTVAMLFDNKMKLLDVIELGVGTVNASPVNLYYLTKEIMRRQAAGVILAHNHPDGMLKPSYDDGAVTRRIYDFLKQMSIPMLEHLIIAGKEVYPILHYSGMYDIDEVASDQFGENFFHSFFEFEVPPSENFNSLKEKE